MAGVLGKTITYLVVPTAIGIGMMNIFQPSEAEINKIKDYNKTNQQFSAVLKAAADPKSKPIYRQKSKELHPAPEIIEEANKK